MVSKYARDLPLLNSLQILGCIEFKVSRNGSKVPGGLGEEIKILFQNRLYTVDGEFVGKDVLPDMSLCGITVYREATAPVAKE